MRILFVIRDMALGGAQRQLLQLAHGMQRRGHMVTVACWRGGSSLLDELHASNVSVVELKPPTYLSLLAICGTLRRVVRTQRIDVIYGLMPVENMICLLARIGTRARLVWGVRTSPRAVAPLSACQRLLFTLQGAACGAPDLVIANSRAGLDLVRRAQRHGKASVIENGTDTDYFSPGESSRETNRRELGMDPGTFIAAVVGRIEEAKGITLFVNAFATFASSHAQCLALIVGRASDRYKNRLMGLAHTLGIHQRVRLVPEQEDIRTVYRAADVLVSPSYGEGMSNVVAEAMACGVPAIATGVGENVRLVGQTGWIVTPGCRRELSDALAQAKSAPLFVLGAAARARIIEHYSVNRMIDRTEATLEQLRAAI
jgi:glycosyltransferase involved in cell wall biosynthesis